ncbi:MAG: hypothetical protein KKB21_01985 [Nanoarchaeota archaeon]|nr:hypothetical protein [Nanoarchaeota archaeon]MBU4086324.1 hypothetical protein [Nanoarchaeota archaeon]
MAVKIQLRNLEAVYARLVNPSGDTDTWKTRDSEIRQRIDLDIGLRPANLPLPMYSAGVVFNRSGDFFSAVFQLVTSDRSLADNLQNQIVAQLKERFMPSAQGGYILNDKGCPIFAISYYDDRKLISLFMGIGGALERCFIFEDEPILFKAFKSQIEEAQAHSNSLLGMLYQNAKEGIVIPDKTLYLSPS